MGASASSCCLLPRWEKVEKKWVGKKVLLPVRPSVPPSDNRRAKGKTFRTWKKHPSFHAQPQSAVRTAALAKRRVGEKIATLLRKAQGARGGSEIWKKPLSPLEPHFRTASKLCRGRRWEGKKMESQVTKMRQSVVKR